MLRPTGSGRFAAADFSHGTLGPPGSCCKRSNATWERTVLSTILIIILILVLIGALPTWPYSRNWGYAPGGILGTVLIVILILALLGRL